MANKISTVHTYPLNGAVDFTITFEYLARKFVKVTLIGKDRKELVLNQDYRFTTKTQITTSRAWTAADGYQMIEIRRFTSASDRLVDFADGSILRAYDLNISQIQTLHVAEEARDLTADTIGVNNDGHLDARGRRIVNLANAVDDRDAVPLGQLKTMDKNSWQARNEALQFRNEAETFRNQAEGFKNESGTNATNTYKWRNEAEGFRDEAEQFKNASGQYADAAGSYAGNAKDSEDEARRIAASIRAAGLFGYITRQSFEKGFNLTVWNEVLLWEEEGEYYRWDGTLPKNVPAGSTPETSGGVGIGAWVSVGDASLRSDMGKPTGAGLSGFDKSVDYETSTVGNELKNIISVNPDMYPTLQDAVDAAAALTGLEHAPSSAANHPDWIQPNTVCKVVRLNGKKYPINTTLHIHGDVSIDAGFGGVYLTDDFIADSSGYAVKCDKGTGNQYAGHISNLLIDARAKTVNGFKISDGYANKLDGIYVANVDGHGIHIAGGMGVHLLKFYAVGVLKPANPLSTAHIVEGSDHQVSMGEGRYFRFGTWVRDGGNNRIDKVHNWGMYDDTVTDQNSRMKCCFVVQNSINNSFNQCFADSPSKWDYTKANLDTVDGYINGGIGFFIDGGATGNTFSQCQTFVNMNAFNDAGLSSYTASLMPFAVGSINCSFIECENSNSPAWVSRLINHIYSIDQSFTNILAAKNFVGIEYDTICNSTIFRKNVGVPVLVRNPKFETPTASYAPNFSDASYISATVTGDVTITPAVLTNILTGYVEVLLAVYSTTSKAITFGANVKLASNTPSLTASGTQVFRLSTTDGGASWFCKFESAYS